MVQLIGQLERLPVTQDKAGARREPGHWIPGPVLPSLGKKGRRVRSNPDVSTVQARCQLHFFKHLHMLKMEGRCSIAADRTRIHLANAH